VVLAVGPEQVAAVLERAAVAGVPAAVIGRAGGEHCIADDAFTVPLSAAHDAWRTAIPNLMQPRS
jgi:hypothetical protein